ncbi:nucleotide exchange factor GrpE [Breznakiellaceae bacterium SP9]
MLNFETELDKLLAGVIEQLPHYEFAQTVEMASDGQEQLEELRKKQADEQGLLEDLLREQSNEQGLLEELRIRQANGQWLLEDLRVKQSKGLGLLEELQKKQTDVSLQVEEIYDLVKEQNTRVLQEAVAAEKKRADTLALTAIALSDLLEDFYAYARQNSSEELRHQAEIVWNKSGQLLASNNLVRFGTEGEPLNPQIHTVQKGVDSPLPRETVLEILQSGYVYKNALVRKAAVVVSQGQREWETKDYE